MKPKKHTLNFINSGKDNKVYLRYFVTYEGKGLNKNIPCGVVLTKEQLALLKSGELWGIIQKELLYNHYCPPEYV